IVLRDQDKRWNCNAVDHAGARGAVVIVVGIAETAIRRNNLLVELADRAHWADSFGLVDAGKEFSFVTIVSHQLAKKMALIDEVGRRVQRVGARGKIDDR